MKGIFKIYLNGELIAECDNIVGFESHNRLLTVDFDDLINMGADDTIRIEYELGFD